MTDTRRARITTEPLDAASLERLSDLIATPTDGAIVTFTGVVRRIDHNREVLQLEYEAHPKAADSLADVVERVAADTGCACAAVHRVGKLGIGDIAVQCAVAAPHRHVAFVACEQLIDLLKATVPIWKRQVFSDGTDEWVGL